MEGEDVCSDFVVNVSVFVLHVESVCSDRKDLLFHDVADRVMSAVLVTEHDHWIGQHWSRDKRAPV